MNREKIKQFKKNVRGEYNPSLTIQRYINTEFVDKTDGNFTQIALRPLLEKNTFLPNSSIYPSLIGLGREIALGEEGYFVSMIRKDIKDEHIKKGSFDMHVLIEKINEVSSNGDVVILVPISFKYEVMLKNGWINYDNEVNNFVFKIGNNKCKVFGIQDSRIKDYIIILDKSFGIWKYKTFEDNEKLELIIGTLEKDNKVDVIARSLIKFEIRNINKIKVIHLEK